MKTVNKKNRVERAGIAHINASFNNTIITITDMSGRVIAWASAGASGFRGSKKSTPYAAQVAANKVAMKVIQDYNMSTIYVEVNGPGSGRESAIRALTVAGLIVTYIKDVTALPHNGCRPRKPRRV